MNSDEDKKDKKRELFSLKKYLLNKFKTLTEDEDDNKLFLFFTDLVSKVFYLIVGIIILDIALNFLMDSDPSKFSIERLGPFGDFMAGILNPLLTFITFWGLIVTIILQRQELKLSREEFKKTTQALVTQS